MSILNYQQRQGEHIQAFAWRTENLLRTTSLNTNITDDDILKRVLCGLYPSIRHILPQPPPDTLERLFVFAEKLPALLPPSDSFWGRSRELPDFSVTVANNSARMANPPANLKCYRCGGSGHYAKTCKNKRVKTAPKCKCCPIHCPKHK